MRRLFGNGGRGGMCAAGESPGVDIPETVLLSTELQQGKQQQGKQQLNTTEANESLMRWIRENSSTAVATCD
jgi:hypothetical protein